MLRKLGILGETQEDSFANGFALGCLMFVITISITVWQMAGALVDYCSLVR